MTQILAVALASYFVGNFFVVEDKKKFLLDFAKGYLVLMLSRFYLHSGLSYLFAAAGVLAGHTRPVFRKFVGDTTETVSLGIIFFMSPVIGFAILSIFIVLKRLFKDYDNAVFASTFLVPLVAFKTFTSDSFIIISLIIFASVAVEFLPAFLEKRINPHKIYQITVGLSVMGILILMYFNKYVYKGFGVQRDIIRHGPHQFKFVALTFDDGPDSEYTPEILDILKEKDTLATFFLVGKNVEAYPEIAERIVREGHLVGNHTYSHKSLIPLSAKTTVYEIKKAEKAIEKATGVRTTLFRPPRGVYTYFARGFLKDERYTIALWDITAVDWAELAPREIVSNVVNKIKPGSIILLHDSGDLISFRGGNRASTVKALPEIIDKLRAQGYEFVTVEQMIFLSELMETEEYANGDYPSGVPAY